MGMYLNPGKQRFQIAINSEIYVDKTGMIRYLNTVLNTNQRYVSVSRPRRFGKTMAADMLCAYYDRTADSRDMFEHTNLVNNTDGAQGKWDEYLNQYNVIRIVMTDFIKPVLSFRILTVLSNKNYSDGRFYKIIIQKSFG